jgi:CheY-like chemotaxis protein
MRHQAQHMPSLPSPVVLVVDDNEYVRRFVGSTLRTAGYDVIEAGNGLEAMAVSARPSVESISLAIIDIVMPGIGGLDLANQLSMDRPRTKILYISGYTNSVAVDSITRERPQSVLQKPFTAEELLKRVRALVSPPVRTDANDPE